DTPSEVARAKVRRADEIFRGAGIGEAIDARMLEESTDHGDHANALGASSHARSQRADAADNEVDLDAVSRRTIQRAHDVRIGEAVQLRGDTRRLSRSRMLRLALDVTK